MIAFLLVIYIIGAIYLVLNFKHDLQMLQQNSYRPERYWRWLRRSGDLSSGWRLTDVALLMLVFAVTLLDIRITALILAIVFLVKCRIILKKKHKKPLVFTRRVWRLYGVSTFISLCLYLPVALGPGLKNEMLGFYPTASVALGVLLLLTIFSWIIVLVALFLLKPVETAINQRYWNEAHEMLQSSPNLKIIGITGSYGKTSTKHYLNRILSEEFEVLMTPGSFNTPMGVIRTVREMLKPYHEVFICEMGAKQLGDIKEICELAHPEMGIVTAVGPMHLESFKSIDNVQRTKFELVDALPSSGLAVVNNDFEFCANRDVENVACIRYTLGNDHNCAFRATDIVVSADGTSFTVLGPDNFELKLQTRLVGDCNISNLLAAIIIAKKLGVSDDKIAYAVADIDQVEHRLSTRRTPGGVTIIDDAFNSNPSGSKMAVDVLAQMKGGKRIIVTPGMIELGDKQFELNKEFGAYLGNKVDVAVIVGKYNRDAISEGVAESELNPDNLHLVESFNEAQSLLSTMLGVGDAVLYENDLPDTFK